ncbi:MAG TPA: ABC transporter permease [Streptosporangiaceae bacterium]|nr:ABC transporter permease [Streptosporangiaceae bacterium]
MSVAEVRADQTRLQSVRRGRISGSELKVAVGVTYLAVLLLAAFVAPLPHSPTATYPQAVLLPPSTSHWLGTDSVGTDVFSRAIKAAAVDLPLALAGTLAALLVGVPLGVSLSASGRWGERGMRLVDCFQALPLLILILALVALSNNQLWVIVVAVAIYGGPVYIRLVRSQVLSLREARFIEAAAAAGASPYRIMRRHLLPNVRDIVLAQTSLVAAGALLGIAALSFLGIGVQPPTPSWGSMISLGAPALVQGQWWPVVGPGAAIFSCIVAFNVVADGLRELGEDGAP